MDDKEFSRVHCFPAPSYQKVAYVFAQKSARKLHETAAIVAAAVIIWVTLGLFRKNGQ